MKQKSGNEETHEELLLMDILWFYSAAAAPQFLQKIVPREKWPPTATSWHKNREREREEDDAARAIFM